MINNWYNWLQRLRFLNYPHLVGLLIGTVFFAFSLTPSLLPRPFLIQGILSGLSFSAGYGLGSLLVWLWSYLELPRIQLRWARVIQGLASFFCLIFVLRFAWQAAEWQNALRAMMDLELLTRSQPIYLGLIAAAVFLVVLLLARLFKWGMHFLALRWQRFVPRRISYLTSFVVVTWLFFSVIDGVLINALMRTANNSFQQLDALIDDHLPRPIHAWQAGSEASLVKWEELGRQGRRFVAGGPTAADLQAFFEEPVVTPVRTYVGLASAETPQQRADLALQELKRSGGFERSMLLLITPTGTGWIDPSSIDTLEYLYRGDVASVAVQYSYLNSPLTMMTNQAYGEETARAVFSAIYGYWRDLPSDSRPRLYLSGISLGSLNSDRSFDLFDIIDDPFQGALWAGPPFRNNTWRRVTAQRDPGSPAWLPTFRDGAVIRFMNRETGLDQGEADWGAFRIAFLQHANDPVTFFSPEIAWTEPDWMREPRGPDVSPDLQWFPLVTMLQLAADTMFGIAPKGFGHEYAPEDYIDAWLALTEPPGWSEDQVQRLKAYFKTAAEAQ